VQRRLYVGILLLSLSVGASGQSKPVRSNQTARPATAKAPAKAKPEAPKPLPETKAPPPKYLTVPLDLGQTNLGADFVGHDITAVFETIRNSPALKEKSEFESTSAFQRRRSGFSDQPLFANVTPTGFFAFVVEGVVYAPQFKYDADAQMLAVALSAQTVSFTMDKDKPTLDGVRIRRINIDRDSYIGSNAYGAKIKVDRTYASEFGVAFNQGNWLFRTAERYSLQQFSYLLAIGPDEAKALKADLKLLLVCRLTDPWFRHSAHGHDPTVTEPYETLVDENYLQISPEQVWIFNSRTGEVVRKLSESSIAADQDQQLSLKLRQTPLLLEVTPYFGGIPDFGEGITGVKFADVREGSPAAKAGLKAGDIMIEFDGKPIQNLYDFTYALRGKKPGDEVKVKVTRDSKLLEVTAVLSRRE
jgi:PDZ domain